MSNKKARRIDLIQGKLEAFSGSLLFIAGITICVTLLFTGTFLSWWLVLPVILLAASPFIIAHAFTELAEDNKTAVKRLEGESEEDYQKAVELNNMLEKLHHYGKGERIQEENSDLFKQLKSSQTAHFMLSLKAEIESKPKKSPVTIVLNSIFSDSSSSAASQQPIEQSNTTSDIASDNFEKRVTSLLEAADTAFKSTAKSSNEILEDKSIIFKRLFTGIVDKTEITRKVFTGSFLSKTSKDKPIYEPVTKRLALFGIGPDGKCVDYSMGMYSREDTWEAMAHYRGNEQFKRMMFYQVAVDENGRGTAMYFDGDRTLKALLKECNVLLLEKRTPEQNKRLEELNKQIVSRQKELANYHDDEKFMTFFKNKLRSEWLSVLFVQQFCNEIREDGKKFVRWCLRDFNDKDFYKYHSKKLNPPSHEIYANAVPASQEHYLHELDKEGGKHCNRLVEVDDFEGLIEGKRHENRFRLCQTQEAYDLYRATWVRP